jgi:hypothetical protein
MEQKSKVLLVCAALAVNNTVRRTVIASNDNGLACKINIPVSPASVPAATDQNHIAVIGIIDCSLDVIEF